MYKLYGDVPEEHKKIAKELEELEVHLEQSSKNIEPKKLAKCYVYLASDWFNVGLDENGTDLIDKASKCCPDYFVEQIRVDMETDATYRVVVEKMYKNMLFIVSDLIREKSEKIS